MKGVFIVGVLALGAFHAATAQPTNVQEVNKGIIRECNGKANRGDVKGQNACFADQITFQGRTVTRESLLANLDDIQTTFPDYHSEIVDIIAEGDVVVTRTGVSGTHKGVAKRTVNGGMPVGVQPTGKRAPMCRISRGISCATGRSSKTTQRATTRGSCDS